MAKTKNTALYRRRKAANLAFLGFSFVATVVGLSWLAIILWKLLVEGVAGITPSLFTETTPTSGTEGGLANAIAGSLIMTSIAVVIGMPIGLFAGTYLAEHGRYTRLAFVVRFVNDILLSAPSIILGLFIYVVMVVPMHGYSGWAGSVALATIVVPVVLRTTEGMLNLIPNTLREAATALGAPRSHVIARVTWRAARAGIITGALLAVARISGETAPLLFTALNNQFWSDFWGSGLNGPIANLPVTIYNLANDADENFHRVAWAGALLITLAVLALSILARIIERQPEHR